MIPGVPWIGEAGTPIRVAGEFGLIDRLRRIAESPTDASPPQNGMGIGIGDDAASFRPTPGREVLVTCDVQVSGRHFVPEWTTPRALGMRAAAVNLSDIGAMGGVPRAALVSLVLGPECRVEDLEEIYRGMRDVFDPLDVRILGGNVGSFPAGLILDLTLLGEVEPERAVRRDGGEAGDTLWATGSPGSAAAGCALLRAGLASPGERDLQILIERYLLPPSRVREGRAIALSGVATSMIDLSDGLIGDAAHLVEGRSLDAVLLVEALPGDPALASAGTRLGRPPESFLLGPSDDYELLFTTRENAPRAIGDLRRAFPGLSIRAIGRLADAGAGAVLLEDRAGRRRPASGGGWDHFRES